MAALGSAHGQDKTLFQLLLICLQSKNIPIKGLTNTSFRKTGIRECQPDMAFYVGTAPPSPK